MRWRGMLAVVFVALACALPGRVWAQAEEDAEGRARALFEQGTRLLEAKDYEGALAKYEAANAVMPRAKIVLNIGAVLALLGRDAEAADRFAAYLDMADRDPDRVSQVESELAELDSRLGRIELRVDLPDAAVLVNQRPIGATPLRRTVRVAPGSAEVSVVGLDGVSQRAVTVQVAAGESRAVDIAPPVEPSAPTPEPAPTAVASSPGVVVRRSSPRHTSLVGAFVRADIDATGRGAVVVPGLSLRLRPGLHAFGAVLVGRDQGAELGVRGMLGRGRVRAIASVAVPVFFADGARPAGRASVGAAVVGWSRWWLTAELGAAYAATVPDGFSRGVVLASAGVEVGF